jgi:glycosyltransferase involved in cell wall biosynthesis
MVGYPAVASIPVLYVLDSHRAGGAELSWVSLVEHLDKNRVAPSFVCPPYEVFDPIVARAERAGARCLGRMQIEGTCDLAGKRRFARALEGFSGIVHFNQNTLDACRHQVRIAARRESLALVSTVRRLCGKPRGRLSFREMRRRGTFSALDRIACVSEALRDELARYAPRARIRVIPNFVSDEMLARAAALAGTRDEARRRLGLAPGARVAACVGIVSENKGQPALVEQLGRALARVPEFVLLLVGADARGLGSDLIARAERAGHGRALRWLGWQDDVLSVLAACDALVHAAEIEGLPRAVQEGMAMGLPAVAYRAGGMEDAIRDGETGILVPAGDAGQLVERLCDLLLDAERARAMGARGRERIFRDFTAAAVIKAYHELYEEVAR